MSFNATWSMAVGGMVGGGIFSVLGVIIGIAGQWAWLSFVLAGLIALISAFSTGSAINATLFSTGRLMETVAKKKDLPNIYVKENNANIPYYAIIIMAGLASVLATLGSLSTLVDAASLIFLITFAIVNFISYQQK